MLKRLREWLGTLADAATLGALGLSALGAAIVASYLQLQKAGEPWVALAAVGATLMVAAALRFGLGWLNSRFDPIGEEHYLRDKRIRVTDLVPQGQSVVKGRTIENCRLFGPAVTAFAGTGLLQGCAFDGDIESLFITVTPGRRVIGPILLEDCVVRNTKFHNVGIMGTADDIVRYKTGFGLKI